MARATDRGSGCFVGAPPGGGVRHGTVVRGGAVEAGLGPCVGQLAARSAAFGVLFRLLCCGGSAGAAQVVCVCPGCPGRESAGGLSQALAAGEDLGARGNSLLQRSRVLLHGLPQLRRSFSAVFSITFEAVELRRFVSALTQRRFDGSAVRYWISMWKVEPGTPGSTRRRAGGSA